MNGMSMSSTTVANEPTYLYRFFSRDGKLLYVGISNSITRRFAEHAATKSWFNLIGHASVEDYTSRPDALTAELLAIQTELPVHNIAGVSVLAPSTVRPSVMFVGQLVSKFTLDRFERALHRRFKQGDNDD